MAQRQTQHHGRPDRINTGVGTPDEHAEAAGLSLGGDAGDVDSPRGTLGEDFGGTGGANATPEWSTVWRGHDKPAGTERPER